MSVGERKVGLDSDLIPSHNLLSTILPLHSSGITCTLQPHYLRMTPHRMALRPSEMRITPLKRMFHHLHDAAHAVAMNTRRFQTSANSSKNPTSSPPLPRQQAENPSLPSFSLIKQLQNTKPAVRYTVYAGLGLIATVETTFWFHVLRAKFFPRASRDEQDKADALLDRLRDAMRGYHHVWMANYVEL
ncbi:hypothetical protein B0T12DRAFT_190279 [Alternaria alternata]|nr:hypothetical protein B0T12DRAFT_190279 [Alternaria alternata]